MITDSQLSNQVVVIGASGFGRETLDVLGAMRNDGISIEVLGVIDDSPSSFNLQRLQQRGVQYLGTLDAWLKSPHAAVKFVLGIGSPKVRRNLVEKLDSVGMVAFTAIHPSATIGSQTTVGEGAVVCSGAVLSTNVRLGRHVHINPNATIGHDTTLEAFVSVNPAAVVSGEVIIRTGALVGASATVLQQLTVGEYGVIGAMALVTKDTPPGVVVKGVPGKW